MPAPYTIEQVASASGLSVKFVRRMKEALPQLFEKHTERGGANALLFDEAILEILKRTKELKNRGRTLQQIRDELSQFAKFPASSASAALPVLPDPFKAMLERENTLLRSQVDLLQNLLRKAEERFDRLLPAATAPPPPPSPKQETLKSQLLLWLVEAVVVTAFASGFIFLIWFFAQKAFRI